MKVVLRVALVAASIASIGSAIGAGVGGLRADAPMACLHAVIVPPQ